MAGLDWPAEFDRTGPSDRRPYPHNFEVSARQALRNVVGELEKFEDVSEIRIVMESGSQRGLDITPPTEYNDPGVVAYWKQDGAEYTAPCDEWDTVRDNAQAIYHYLKAKRGMERWGVESTKSELSTQRREKQLVDRE